MTMGAPPKYHSHEEVHKLGKELIAYINKRCEEGNPIYHMNEWYFDVKGMFDKEWNSLRGRDNFVHYYEQARIKLANGMMRDKNLAQSYGGRFLAMYRSDLREHEREVAREKAKDEIDLKKADAINLSPEAVDFNNRVMEKLDSLQKKD